MPAIRFSTNLANNTKSYRNGFKDSAVVGSLMFQWGQDNNTKDGVEQYDFQTPFASQCYAVLTTASMFNVGSGLPVVAREKTCFKVDRDRGIDGLYPFYWIAVGDAPETRAGKVRHYDVNPETSVFWGDGVSKSDKDEVFETPVALGEGPAVVLTTVNRVNARNMLPATNFDARNRKLTIKRHHDIDGSMEFNYIGVGSVRSNKTPNSASSAVAILGDFKIQWGTAQSTSDYEELFPLPDAFADMNFAVITTMAVAGTRMGLSLTRPINSRSFIVDRTGSVDGKRDFHWLAIGR